jgi:hypothetical protein
MQNLPVNSMPTIAIDYYNLYPWGWVDVSGVNVMFSGSAQSVFIASNSNPITAGYVPNQRVFVHKQSGLVALDIVAGTSNFTFVAYLDQQGDGGIAFGAPNIKLTGGKSISNNSITIFFGIPSPAYWTIDTENMFRNAVSWATNIDYTPPSATTLFGPSSTHSSSATYTWSVATAVNGIQTYQVQVSLTSDFTAIIADKKTSALSYTLTKMMEGQTYYVRVRAIDNLNMQSPWSNTISTIADFSDMLFTIVSPVNGTQLHLGENVFVDVNFNAPRLPDGTNCVISIGGEFIGNLIYDLSSRKCSGNITIPTTLGAGGFPYSLFTITATNSLGTTNSSSITVFFDRSLSLGISTDKSIYSPGETVTVSGYLTMQDNGAKVSNALIEYSVDNIDNSTQTDSNGFYSFSIYNLAEGTYTAIVDAIYKSTLVSNSASFMVARSSGSSAVVGGSLNAGAGAALLSLTVPSTVTGYENSDQVIYATVKNIGAGTIRGLKITVSGIQADVEPTLIDLGTGQYQNFKITLHIPYGTGDKQLTIKALSLGAYRTKKITLTVLPELPAPELKIGAIDLPTFNQDEETSVNITVENIGNTTTTASATISLPTGWSAAETEKTFEILSNSQEKISFVVIPSDQPGQISFYINYLAKDEQKQISQTVDVNPIHKQTSSITGLIIAGLMNPQFYLLAVVAAVVFSSLVLSKKVSVKFLKMPIKVSQSVKNDFTSTARKINPAANYLEWERKYRIH